MRLSWELVMENGRDIEAVTEYGTYTISFDSPEVGGTAYLWLPGDDVDAFMAYDQPEEARIMAERDYAARVLDNPGNPT